jgi:hypothetical protein
MIIPLFNDYQDMCLPSTLAFVLNKIGCNEPDICQSMHDLHLKKDCQIINHSLSFGDQHRAIRDWAIIVDLAINKKMDVIFSVFDYDWDVDLSEAKWHMVCLQSNGKIYDCAEENFMDFEDWFNLLSRNIVFSEAFSILKQEKKPRKRRKTKK